MTLFKDTNQSHSLSYSSYFEKYSNRVLHPLPLNQLTNVKSVVLRKYLSLKTLDVLHKKKKKFLAFKINFLYSRHLGWKADTSSFVFFGLKCNRLVTSIN